MVENKLTGSLELKESLPDGVLTKMAETFDKSVGWVGKVVKGSKNGDPLILECAHKISDAYKASNFEEVCKAILKDYKNTGSAKDQQVLKL